MADDRKTRRERFVVLPGFGITARAMSAGIFDGNTKLRPVETVKMELDRVMGAASGGGSMPSSSGGATASNPLTASIEDGDIEIVSKTFPEGPALVQMTPAARLAFECANPSLRVLPVTRYNLPGYKTRGGRIAGSLPTGCNAIQADGSVFPNDFRQHVLSSACTRPGDGTGEGVRVAVIDTGIDADHPALKKAVQVLRCTVPSEGRSDCREGRPVNWGPQNIEMAGHGTHVAGIIAAAGGHTGPAGIAPDAAIAGYRIFPDNPRGVTGAENTAILDAILYAIEDECDIINLSIEGQNLKEDGVRTAIFDAWAQGIVCVAAAGNGYGRSVSYPAALPHCVAVTAVGREGHFPKTDAFISHCSSYRSRHDATIFLASFSNYGPTVQFAAPGHGIVSTFPDNGWWIQSGTSMAAPFVCGVLARALSADEKVRNMPRDSARSDAMLQLLVRRATKLGLPQTAYEGYGLPC